MKKSTSVLIGLAVIAIIAVIVAWPSVRIKFASSASYTEQDKQQYEYYTPDIIKRMPKISRSYDFRFSRITGTEANVYSIQFYDTTDIQPIKDYLKLKGYELQATCDIEAQCWKSHTTKDEVTVGIVYPEKWVLVQVYRPL